MVELTEAVTAEISSQLFLSLPTFYIILCWKSYLLNIKVNIFFRNWSVKKEYQQHFISTQERNKGEREAELSLHSASKSVWLLAAMGPAL